MYSNKQKGGSANHGPFSNSLTPEDVNDIIDRLNVGTLRREALKERLPIHGTIEVAASVSGVSDHDFDQSHEDLSHTEVGRDNYGMSSVGELDGDENQKRRKGKNKVGKKSSSSSNEFSVESGAKMREKSSRKTSRGSGSGESDTSSARASGYEQLGGASQEPTSPNWRGPSLLDALTPIKDLKLSPMDKLRRLFRRLSPGDNNEDEMQPKFPQQFLTKYMGKKSTKGLWGDKYTRKHVETCVDKTGELARWGGDLPLVTIEVTMAGLRMMPHKRNKVGTFTEAFVPIEYISYGVQDSVYPRLFSFIMVKEMSAVKRRLECHVYACDTVVSSRRLATALAIAFQSYSDSLQGAPCKFSVSVKNREDDTVSSYDA